MKRVIAPVLTVLLLSTTLALAGVSAPNAIAAPPDACARERVDDIAGDGDADIDIASISVVSDCTRLTFTLTTHEPFTDDQLGRWDIVIGPRIFRDRGCNGMTNLLTVRHRPGSGLEAFSTQIERCGSAGASYPQTARRISPTSISITARRFSWPNGRLGESFRWQSATQSSNGTLIDVAPRYATIVWPRLGVSWLEVTHTFDRRALALEWPVDDEHQLIDRFELQYRAGNARWSRIRRIGPWERYFELTGLTPGTEYTLRFTSVSNGRRGRWTYKTIVYTTAPGAPQNLRATSRGSTLTVRFDPPAVTGGQTLGYRVIARWEGGQWSGTVSGRPLAYSFVPGSFPVTIWVAAAADVDPSLIPWARLHVTEPPPPDS